MRRTRLACALLVAVLPLFPLSAAEPQKPEPGFGGLTWGDAPTSDMALVEGRADGEATYRRDGETPRVEGHEAEAARYVFWKGRLVMVGLHGASGFSAVLDTLAQTWGPGYQADAHAPRYTWTSHGAAGRTIAGLDVQNGTGYYLALFSEEGTDAMELEQTLTTR